MEKNDSYYMREALKEAYQSFERKEVPIGAVIVSEGKIIGRAGNQMELLQDATAHAEILAITQASATIRNWRLDNTTLFVTKEPCIMCLGAIIFSRIPRIVIGALDDQDRGIRDFLHPGYEALMKKISFEYGCMEEDCKAILQDFFKDIRHEKD